MLVVGFIVRNYTFLGIPFSVTFLRPKKSPKKSRLTQNPRHFSTFRRRQKNSPLHSSQASPFILWRLKQFLASPASKRKNTGIVAKAVVQLRLERDSTNLIDHATVNPTIKICAKSAQQNLRRICAKIPSTPHSTIR